MCYKWWLWDSSHNLWTTLYYLTNLFSFKKNIFIYI